MARRPTKLKEHVPFTGVPSITDIASALALPGEAGQVPIPARTPTGLGYMQIGVPAGVIAPSVVPALAGAQFTPGIPAPTGQEIDPWGRQVTFATGLTGALPEEPAPVVDPVVEDKKVVAKDIQVPVIPDIGLEAIPGVTQPTTRSIEELQNIASMLAPQVETQPLTREQLVGGDVFGLTPEQVHNVTATRVAQLQTKSAADKNALDFLRQSTGVKTAEKLVADKIQEEGAMARAKFITESSAAEAAKARRSNLRLEKYKLKTNLANRLLVAKAEAAEKAAGPTSAVDLWKATKAEILLEFSKSNPIAAAGLTRIPDIDDAIAKIEADKALPDDSSLKMTEDEHRMYTNIVSLGIPPLQEEF